MSGEAARCAETAAEAVRALNQATLPGASTLTGPGDVYDVVGCLATLAARLPQALSQLQAFLAREHQAGRVQILDPHHACDPAAALADIAHELTCAAGSADLLREALEHAHTTLTCTAGPHRD